MTQTLLYFTYYGVMCVALTPNLLMAAVASNSLYLTMNLFSGFVIPAPVSSLFLSTPLPLLNPCFFPPPLLLHFELSRLYRLSKPSREKLISGCRTFLAGGLEPIG